LEVSLAADPTYECCTGRGAVLALNAASGEVLWKTYTVEETPVVQSQNRSETNMIGPSGAMVWNSPTIDAKRNQLYIGTGENMSSPATLTSDAIFAMDLDSGKVNWVFQATANDAWNVACGTRRPDSCPEEDGPDFDFGAGTLMLTAPTVGDLVIGGQKSGKVHALNPDTGELVWQTRVGRGGIQGGVHFGMAADSDQLYVPISDMADGRTYPDPDRPGIHALDPDTGEELWWSVSPDVCDGRYFCHPGVSQAITTTSGMVFAGGMDGVLRIHDSTSGEVLWEMDSTQTIPTVSGAEAFGGSFGGGSAPILQDGVMVLSSGYGIYLHMPGNLLMVFEVGEES
jgi:polyvinyl alcohol dehydrogenase (cytochrome)